MTLQRHVSEHSKDWLSIRFGTATVHSRTLTTFFNSTEVMKLLVVCDGAFDHLARTWVTMYRPVGFGEWNIERTVSGVNMFKRGWGILAIAGQARYHGVRRKTPKPATTPTMGSK